MSKHTQSSPISRLSSSASRLLRHLRLVPLGFRLGAICLLLCLVCPLRQECVRAAGEELKAADPLVIEPKIVDFGRVNDAKSPLELSFTITNRGNQPVEITGARSGCGCTVAKLSQSVVPPHDHITVSVKVNILGRQGKFENHVVLDVAGRTEPITVPLQGRVIQDLWFDGPMIQCFATGLETTVEKTFEIHTVDWPSVQFDWKALDKAISVQELSRSKSVDETIIKFRLRLRDVPTDKSSTTRHAILVPLDKQIRPLMVQIGCYRPIPRRVESQPVGRPKQNSAKTSDEGPQVLHPARISVGVIPRGEERRFNVSGPLELVNSLKIVGLENLPDGTKVELHPLNDLEKDSLGITFRVAESAPWGLFDGRIRLKSPDGSEFSIAVVGIMGPGHAGDKPHEEKHVQDANRQPNGTLSAR